MSTHLGIYCIYIVDQDFLLLEEEKEQENVDETRGFVSLKNANATWSQVSYPKDPCYIDKYE